MTIRCVFLSVFFFAFSLELSADHEKALELLNAACKVPESIKKGEYIINTWHQKFGDYAQNHKGLFQIIFDEKKIRIQRENAGRVTIYCTPYENSDQSFFFASNPKSIIKQDRNIPGLPEAILESLIIYKREDFENLYCDRLSEDTTIPCIQTMGYVTDDIFFSNPAFYKFASICQVFCRSKTIGRWFSCRFGNAGKI
jgi:hypothetical protein